MLVVHLMVPLVEMDLGQWEQTMQINLTSVFQICSSIIPKMRKNGGLVINVSSHASYNAFSQWGAYCISKSALAMFTKCLREEERSNSIRACTITLRFSKYSSLGLGIYQC